MQPLPVVVLNAAQDACLVNRWPTIFHTSFTLIRFGLKVEPPLILSEGVTVPISEKSA